MRSIIKKMGLLKILKKIFRSINYTNSININGRKFKVLKLYETRFVHAEYWMSELLKKIMKVKPGNFIDVGVNIGQTLLQVKSIDKDYKYLGLEPNPSCNMYVEELIRINNIKDASIIPVGLFNRDMILTLDLYWDDITNSGGSLIKDYWEYEGKHKVQRKINVPVFTWETLTKSEEIKRLVDKIGIIKIDVEGAELEVLESISAEINRCKPFIIIEILSAYSKDNKLRYNRQEKILEIIKNIDYKILRILEDRQHKFEKFIRTDEFDPEYDHRMSNFLLYSSNDERMIQELFKDYIE